MKLTIFDILFGGYFQQLCHCIHSKEEKSVQTVQTVQGAKGQIMRYRAMTSVPVHRARQKLISGTFGNFFKEHAALMSHGIFCG